MHLAFLPTETLGTGGTRGGLSSIAWGAVMHLERRRWGPIAPKKPKPGGLEGPPFRRPLQSDLLRPKLPDPLQDMVLAINASVGGYCRTNVRMQLREAHGQDAGRLGAPSLVAKVARSCKRCPQSRTVSGLLLLQVPHDGVDESLGASKDPHGRQAE